MRHDDVYAGRNGGEGGWRVEAVFVLGVGNAQSPNVGVYRDT